MGDSVFVLGGARSGKSRFAVQLAREAGGKVAFIATAARSDEEMNLRIEAHRRARPRDWLTLETETGLANALQRDGPHEIVLVDCLSLLVSNLLLRASESDAAEDLAQLGIDAAAEIDDLFRACADARLLIIVSNEVGQGVVPETPLGRRYRDLLGTANQHAARLARQAYWVVAGMPQKIKG